MTCFYCGASVKVGAKPTDNERATKDHIYPLSLIRSLTNAQRAKLPDEFWDLNKVECCQTCNAYKGHLHPLDWIVIMPNSYNAARLAERLVNMGEDMEEVFLSLHRRRK